MHLILDHDWTGPLPCIRAQVHPYFRRLRATRFYNYVQRIQVAFNLEFDEGQIHAASRAARPDLILTVAHGPLAMVALRISKSLKIPLVSLFHDWWPHFTSPYWPRNSEACFLKLYRESRVAMCISEGMKIQLGPHRDSRVLLPIPGPRRPLSSLQQNGSFKIIYAGAMHGVYQAGINSLIECTKEWCGLSFVFSGDATGWSSSKISRLSRAGIYVGNIQGESRELDELLGAADALLVHQSFDKHQCRRVETSFPSKIAEYSRFGKPLVAWAPSASSGACWVRQNKCGIVVDDACPLKLISAINALSENRELIRTFGKNSIEMSETVFDPAAIQAAFLSGLKAACSRQ